MLILNFAHPLTSAHLTRLAELLGVVVAQLSVRDISTRFDQTAPFAPQARALADAAQLDAVAWQTLPIIVNLPGHSAIAATLLAEIEGRRGHLPDVMRLRPVDGVTPLTFEVAEVVSLYGIRRIAADGRR
jgi:hypothetical protein